MDESVEDVPEALEPPLGTVDDTLQVEFVVAAPPLASVSTDTVFLEESPFPGLAEEPVSAPPVPTLEANSPVLPALERFAATLDRGLAEFRTLVERDRRAEETREKVVDRLHAELQDYKNDLLLKLLRPIFLDLVQLHDDLGKRAETSEDERTAAILRDYQQGIEDILYRQGVEPFEGEGEGFDPKRQRAVATIATDIPELNKQIAGRIRKGFATGEKVIRPELVSVFATRR
jgi:molecular chaperone GrpE